MKEIYLAGGCYWGVEKYMSNLKGVTGTTVGFANGDTEEPTYQQVRYENTGHAETVRVEYDPSVLTLPVLLDLFYKIIDPTSVDQQGEDVGHQYRTGVYFTDENDAPIIRESRDRLEKRIGRPLAMETCKLEQFWPAEEYHQKYLDKNPTGYCHVPFQMISWVKTVDPEKYCIED
ncbi:MAG: peptide-methionine (S)-S-oxide reductase MsrA [Lachnospiraceae bacterium]|nr:peptide-methionine (S)-S-oxide reductase MsrA [Lachnospiraceae bacterium]